jgi:hypothetical protein
MVGRGCIFLDSLNFKIKEKDLEDFKEASGLCCEATSEQTVSC